MSQIRRRMAETMSQIRRRMAETMNYLPRNARYASQFTLHENEIQSTKYYVRNYQGIMQNKPNFRKAKMNVSIFSTMDYENISDWTIGQNKPNSNPIKPNLQKAQMNVNLTLTKDYRKKDDFIVRINKPNFQNAKIERKLICDRGL